jgi:nucleoside-diphosphate-sugar epimerase
VRPGAVSGERRCVLVTGATGVLGSAVASALEGHDVIRLCRGSDRTREGDVSGDVREPRLGLGVLYAELRRRVDCVVHCAATSNYASREVDVRAINVTGTENVLDFCADAEAHLYHVGTAFDRVGEAAEGQPESLFSRQPYLRSKRDAERLVRTSGIPATATRPSLIIGDRETGAVPRFQGIHTMTRLLLTSTYGVVPAEPDHRADFLPRDTIAAAIACLVEDGSTPEECWLTAGDAALTMRAMVDLAVEYGRSIGLDPQAPRFMEREVIDRLVRPALIPELPRRERQRFEYVLEYVAEVNHVGVLPSSLGEFAGRIPIPTTADLEQAFLNTLRYWGRVSGIAPAAEKVG